MEMLHETRQWFHGTATRPSPMDMLNATRQWFANVPVADAPGETLVRLHCRSIGKPQWTRTTKKCFISIVDPQAIPDGSIGDPSLRLLCGVPKPAVRRGGDSS